MRTRGRRADGFQVASGVLGVATGPLLLAHGKPAGAFLLIAAGIALLATQLVVVLDLRFAALDTTQILLVAGGSALVAVALVYLTRAAGGRPWSLPGYGESGTLRIASGLVTLVIGVALFARAVVAARPARISD